MRKLAGIGAGLVLAAVAMAGSAANAADASQGFTWQGGYIGLQGGYGWAADNAAGAFGGADAQTDPRGWIAGGQFGFNWEFQNGAVFGIETALGLTGMTGNTTFNYGPVPPSPGNIAVSEKVEKYGSVRARAGAGLGAVMPYVTGGFAFASVARTGGGTTMSKPFTGWTAGAGLEIAAGDHWSVRGEYGYYDFGTQNFLGVPGPPGGSNVHLTASLVTGAINYRW